ncbi:hypothetical protein [Legionella tunisiensis]|uniref:hypothetical protein n=1 Tax=Legionella tunisiensis TaxID=1034944 RepID=UPI0038B9FAEA
MTKEQKIRALMPVNNQQNLYTVKNAWYKGLGIGIFGAMAVVGSLSYFKLLNHDKLSVITLTMAIAGGFIAFINRTSNRS